MNSSPETGKIKSECNPWIASLKPYQAGKSIEEIQSSYNLTKVVKLGSNENNYGPSPLALSALAEAGVNICRYPDGASLDLRATLAAFYNLQKENVAVCNGSDEALLLLALAFLKPGDETLAPVPTFSQYECVTQIAGASFQAFMCSPHEPINISALLQKVRAKTRILFLCSPNNPTGAAYTKDQLTFILQSVPANILVVVDEAYGEYSDENLHPPAHTLLSQFPQLIVLHTFSKVYGLAGLRVGYALAHKDLVAGMEKVRNFNVFNINIPGQKAALAALTDRAYTKSIVERNSSERQRVYHCLVKYGYRVLPSQANFLCVYIGSEAEVWYKSLLSQGCITRYLASFGMPEWVRVTLGTPSENDFFLDLAGHNVPGGLA